MLSVPHGAQAHPAPKAVVMQAPVATRESAQLSQTDTDILAIRTWIMNFLAGSVSMTLWVCSIGTEAASVATRRTERTLFIVVCGQVILTSKSA